MDRERELVLAGLLAVLVVIGLVVLRKILPAVVFAITVAYVLYPLRQRLFERGFSRRIASGLATSVAFLAVVALIAPIVFVVNRRRHKLSQIIDQVPETISVTVADMEYTAETAVIGETAEGILREIAVSVALAAPALVLELAVFTLLVYGILLRPDAISRAVAKLVPTEYHDIVMALHRRTQTTLFSIYILQAATAAGTAVIAAVVFWALGYTAVISLAVIAGILQFIPILGPSVVILGLAAYDVLLGNITRAALVVGIGLVFIGFVPDAIIRTRLASKTGELAASLYFVGFVGGILTIGAIGIIIGPLVMALLVEVITLISDRSTGTQATLEESVTAPADEGETSGE